MIILITTTIIVASQPMKHQVQSNDDDDNDDEDDDDVDVSQRDGKKKRKKAKRSDYGVISKRKQPCAIIINNIKFKKSEDIDLPERTWSENNGDVDKILTLEKEFGICFKVHKNQGAQLMKEVLANAVDSQSTYSALLVFIMTHGTSGDMLYGSDGEPISLEELVECFEADKCTALKDKPKIFILHYRRGEKEEPAQREGRGHASKRSSSYGN